MLLKMKAVTSFWVLFTITICFVGSYGADVKHCIHGKFTTSIGPAGYTECYKRSGATEIPKMKQCFVEVLKERKAVKVAHGGQMTVDRQKFHESAASLEKTSVGKAMMVCYKKPNNDEMYKEAARASQCVFQELKKGC